MKNIKLFLVWMLIAVLAVSPVLAESSGSAEEDALAYLGRELDAAAKRLIRLGEDMDDVYTEISWQSMADTFPEKFDLRERGTVTPVKNQNPWSTCWSFADIAASETSILNTLGMTAEPMEDSEKNPMDFGGNNILALTTLANGCGIVTEQLVPYTDSDGGLDGEGDWSLPEIMRYAVSIELKNANLLPSPAMVDAEEHYTYQAAGTEAIKSELMAGRAVAVYIRADVSAPGQARMLTPEEKQAQMTAYLEDREGASADGVAEDCYDLSLYGKEELMRILKSAGFGRPIEDVLAERGQDGFSVLVGTDPEIIAQYAYEPAQSTHVVTVVGWDDTFAADNWPEDRRPPADGAWIAKNSWGADWGNAGYFLISYYDMSLNGICTFEYVTGENGPDLNTLEILAHDHMPAENIHSTLFTDPVYAASIFTIEADSVLQYVSAMTGDLDTTVTASVYLLNGDAATPEDGTLLGSYTETFRYAGYHRLTLDGGLQLPAGGRIAVAVLETVPAGDGVKYALVNTSSMNLKGAEEHNAIAGRYGITVSRYATGIINRGESFVSFESGKWTDWADAVAAFGSTGSNAGMAYDNLPVKACIYPLAEVK